MSTAIDIKALQVDLNKYQEERLKNLNMFDYLDYVGPPPIHVSCPECEADMIFGDDYLCESCREARV